MQLLVLVVVSVVCYSIASLLPQPVAVFAAATAFVALVIESEIQNLEMPEWAM